jgi:medium-chain acyl-[acyl-carrier-protein] hydrolase
VIAADPRRVYRPRPRPDASLRLYCFAHAGAGAGAYRAWGEGLPATIDVCAVRLPGRESRIDEPPRTRLDDILAELVPLVAGGPAPFAFFGHSLGALVAFELARALEDRGLPGPRHLVVSGHAAPQLGGQADDAPASDAELLDDLRGLGGTTGDVLGNRELLELVLPIVRADFAVSAAYRFVAGAPLGCPLTALGGAGDPGVTLAALEAWRVHTRGGFALRQFPGGHFFIDSARPAVLAAVAAAVG